MTTETTVPSRCRDATVHRPVQTLTTITAGNTDEITDIARQIDIGYVNITTSATLTAQDMVRIDGASIDYRSRCFATTTGSYFQIIPSTQIEGAATRNSDTLAAIPPNS